MKAAPVLGFGILGLTIAATAPASAAVSTPPAFYVAPSSSATLPAVATVQPPSLNGAGCPAHANRSVNVLNFTYDKVSEFTNAFGDTYCTYHVYGQVTGGLAVDLGFREYSF
jgi:hypothetical protein